MTLFAFLLLPLGGLSWKSFFYDDENMGHILHMFFRGILYYLPALVLYYFNQEFVSFVWEPASIYFSFILKDYSIGILFALAIFFIHGKWRHLYGRERQVSMTAFLLGFFFIATLVNTFFDYKTLNAYNYFFQPLLIFGLCLVIPVFLEQFLTRQGLFRFVFLFGLLALPWLLGLVPMLFYTSQAFIAAVLSIISASGMVVGAVFLKE